MSEKITQLNEKDKHLNISRMRCSYMGLFYKIKESVFQFFRWNFFKFFLIMMEITTILAYNLKKIKAW